MTDRNLTFNRYSEPMAKDTLVKGEYYIGICRNARIARWDGERFWHWRLKWGQHFIECIRHRDDDTAFDVFDAWAHVDDPYSVTPIEFPEK